MSGSIHPTAIVDPGARIGRDVTIGPYAVIEADVELGDGCLIMPHAVIGSGTRMGAGCRVFPGACVGLIPQDLKFEGEPSVTIVGERTTIRECATINRGTKASGRTVVGDDCLLMAYSHVGHDCVVGNHAVFANGVALAGHVIVGNHVNLGGVVVVHQFTHIGDHAFVGLSCMINQDIVPFALVASEPTRIVGINKVGLERRGFSDQRRRNITRMFRTFFRQGLAKDDALAKIAEAYPGDPDAGLFTDFVKGATRSLMRMGGADQA